ncbi:MAG: LysM peptidoglycan-binding domain-containing protein [Ferruginibacter sp.]|nr:LysM peptidoglycan-binding domain-containing protein [Ferruginibacter sp.]
MKKILFVLFLLPFFAAAQKGIEIKPVKMHTVGPKENLSSIGRLYEVNGRVLANYNSIDYDKGLTIGQVLKIPPKGTTLDQVAPPVKQVTEPVKKEETLIQPPAVKSETKAETNEETGTPVYHKVGKKETLYHISTLYPGVTIDDLKKWNNLTGDAVNEGANLVVGYKKATADLKKTAIEKTEKAKPVVAETVKKEPANAVKGTEKTDPAITDVAGKNSKGGAFKALFESQSSNWNVINEQGSFGVFKSTSGWNDGKYYCLYNNASPGTIIKIASTSTGKIVYAKVLDVMPDLKQNDGLLILISNAAANELGVAENNYGCNISYSK